MLTANIAMAFDQDAAGGAATLRGLDIARQQEFSIKLITLPPEAGKDPDEACKKDPHLWRQAIANATGIIDWVYKRAFTRHSAGTPEGKRAIADEILPELSRILHPIEREAWVKRLATDLGISEGVLQASLRAGKRGAPAAVVTPKSVTNVSEAQLKIEDRPAWRWLALGLVSAQDFSELFVLDAPPLELTNEPELQALYVGLRSAYSATGFPPSNAMAWSQALSRLAVSLGPNETMTYNTLTLLAEHAFSSFSRAEISYERQQLTRQLRQAARARVREELQNEMRRAEAAGDVARINELVQRFSALSQD